MDNYKIKDGVLTVLKDLRQEFDLSFDQACSQLLQEPKDDIIIDLALVSYISSTYIGMIAATFFQAQAKGKALKVRARANVLQVLRAAGFDGFISLESI